jgi:hypothetical protein
MLCCALKHACISECNSFKIQLLLMYVIFLNLYILKILLRLTDGSVLIFTGFSIKGLQPVTFEKSQYKRNGVYVTWCGRFLTVSG